MAFLPTSFKDNMFPSRSGSALVRLRFFTRRYLVFVLTGLCLTIVLVRMLYVRPLQDVVEHQHESSRWRGHPLPPLYPQYHEYELKLPQHHWSPPSLNGQPKFLFVRGHSRGCGWGNIWQEILMNAHLAYKTNRSFVFYNYTWSDNEVYSNYQGKPIPSRIPLTALIRGPIVGGAFPPGPHPPPAVAEEYYRTICTSPTTIDREKVQEPLHSSKMNDIADAWVGTLATVDDQCVEVSNNGGAGLIYDWIAFGDRHALDAIWPDLAASPVITHFAWSHLVELAFDTNREIISPTTVYEPPLISLPDSTNAERYTELSGLLVLHIRRGDYSHHCKHLAKWSSTFLAFNALPQFEQFDPPPGGSWGENTPENYELYRRRCYPTAQEVVARVQEVQRSAAAGGLDHVYVMTNGAVEWVEELKLALMNMGGFKHVSSSRDLVLNREQKYVAQAVDMLVGQRAQVFIGNGWSSLTGGIVVMRAANQFHTDTTRFF